MYGFWDIKEKRGPLHVTIVSAHLLKGWTFSMFLPSNYSKQSPKVKNCIPFVYICHLSLAGLVDILKVIFQNSKQAFNVDTAWVWETGVVFGLYLAGVRTIEALLSSSFVFVFCYIHNSCHFTTEWNDFELLGACDNHIKC